MGPASLGVSLLTAGFVGMVFTIQVGAPWACRYETYLPGAPQVKRGGNSVHSSPESTHTCCVAAKMQHPEHSY